MNHIPPPNMDAVVAMNLGRHIKAALLHLAQAEAIADEAGVNLDYGGALAVLFRNAYEHTQDLDMWAVNNARANGDFRLTYHRTEQWCQSPGGTLPIVIAGS